MVVNTEEKSCMRKNVLYEFQGVAIYLICLSDEHIVLNCLFNQKKLVLEVSRDDVVILESDMDGAQQYYISQSLKDRYGELLSKAKKHEIEERKWLEEQEFFDLDKKMCELEERLKNDELFRKEFYKEIEELEKIKLLITEEDETPFTM